MDQPDHEAEPYFAQPVRQIITMLIILGLVGFGTYIAFPRVAPVFLANPMLNGFILFVFLVGVFACFWQVFQLVTSVNWIEGFVADRDVIETASAPRLLAPLAALLRSHSAKMQIGASSSRSILDSVGTRIEEARDITRYIVNLLIFLGLLGTFYGLATTVPALVETIRALAPSSGESGIEVFGRLMSGLEKQLGGMGTAFASSLLGLAGSLVVGLLELFASHGQNRFYRELEEWLSTITRVGFSSGDGDGGEQGVIAGVLDHMAEQMEAMRTMFTQSDVSRAMVDEKLGLLATSVERLTDRMARETGTPDALMRVADGQDALVQLLTKQAEEGGPHVDAESRMRLRSIDVQLLRVLEEMSAGRQEVTGELRNDLAALTKAIRAVTPRGGGRGQG
ncbi:MAG: biopolymer transporter ExbB [Marinosulfonomonas sp.]|nr:MAG: biopolymer transporter ExbB [Marinosulfonomonas sp.]